MIFGIFGIGIIELIILGAIAGAIVGVLIYFFTGSGKGDE